MPEKTPPASSTTTSSLGQTFDSASVDDAGLAPFCSEALTGPGVAQSPPCENSQAQSTPPSVLPDDISLNTPSLMQHFAHVDTNRINAFKNIDRQG
eukprot:12721420-Prorocentrum_lima.AAC.1